MATKKKKTPARQRAEAAYNKERGRIKRQINRMKAAGYRFEEEQTPASISALSGISTQKLKAETKKLSKIKTADLYGRSTALSESGEIVAGTQAKKERASARARAAWKTRKAKKEEPIGPDWYGGAVSEGEVVYHRILDLINWISESPSAMQQARAIDLNQMLQQQIVQYGFDHVMEALAQSPEEAWEDARLAIMYNDININSKAFEALYVLITGEIPSDEEKRKMQDQAEGADYFSDFQEV